MFCGERAVQMHLHHADLFSPGLQIVNHFHNGFADGAHGNDDVLGIRCPIVVEQLIMAAGQSIDGIHLFLHDVRQSCIGCVAGFTALEEGVRVLECGTDGRMLGVEGMILKPFDHIPIHQRTKIL